MKGLAEAVAFVALIIAATWLECNGKPAGGLWVVVVIWALCSDWGQKKS